MTKPAGSSELKRVSAGDAVSVCETKEWKPVSGVAADASANANESNAVSGDALVAVSAANPLWSGKPSSTAATAAAADRDRTAAQVAPLGASRFRFMFFCPFGLSGAAPCHGTITILLFAGRTLRTNQNTIFGQIQTWCSSIHLRMVMPTRLRNTRRKSSCEA